MGGALLLDASPVACPGPWAQLPMGMALRTLEMMAIALRFHLWHLL